jgi:hypothetical protein
MGEAEADVVDEGVSVWVEMGIHLRTRTAVVVVAIGDYNDSVKLEEEDVCVVQDDEVRILPHIPGRELPIFLILMM